MIATLTVAVQEPPANDDFADATEIAASFSTTIGEAEAAAATVEPGEPKPSCMTDDQVHTTVWYRIAPPSGAHLTVYSISGATTAIYRGTSLASLVETACAEGGATVVDAAAGDTYYIQLVASTFQASDLNVDWVGPPPNDDFEASIALTDLSSPVIADLSAATVEANEPTPSCVPDRVQTAWWSFTAPDDGTLTVAGTSEFWAAYAGSTLAGLTELECRGSGVTVPIELTAGQTVHLQVGLVNAQAGAGSLQLGFTTSPDNDDFADALRVAVGDVVQIDRSGGTVEPGEPNPPACAFGPGSSVWYTFVGTGKSVSFGLDQGSQSWAIAAYTGSSVDGLTQLGCRLFDGAPLTIKPAVGERVHLQVWSFDFCCSTTTTLRVTKPGKPSPAFSTSIADPSVFDDITFFDQTTDPGGNPIVAWKWDFGDRSTSTDQNPVHRFTKDGDHRVSLKVTTSDGRTGSVTQTVTVRTHDVGIGRFDVQESDKVGQTRRITVGVGNTRYPETVSILLQVSRPGGTWQDVGSVIRDIPVLKKKQTVDVGFDYTFVAADATAGKATFRAVVSLVAARDALPSDNEAISVATRVRR
jgi:PKD repeat protein